MNYIKLFLFSFSLLFANLVFASSTDIADIPSSIENGDIVFNLEEGKLQDEAEEEKICVICLDTVENEDGVLLDCGHVFHKECIRKWSERKAICPLCKNKINLEKSGLGFCSCCPRLTRKKILVYFVAGIFITVASGGIFSSVFLM